MAHLSFRETLRRYIPPWLSDRPTSGRTAGFRFLYGFAAVLDAGMQFLVEGMQARLPGIGTATALPYLGRDRRIIRGPHESDADYAARLLDWLDLWRAAGNAYALAKALQAFLAPGHPRIRIVTRSGFWWTLDPSGELTWHRSSPNNWNWDSLTHPENAGCWADFWVVVYSPHFPTDGTWGDGRSFWGEPKVFGQDVSVTNAETIRALIRQWKGAHSRCVALIFTYDPQSFDPLSPPGSPGMPDGRWGHWSRDDGAGRRVRSRRADARFWEV